MSEHSNWQYDLFISYRRTDASALARHLRWKLQRYRVPAEVLQRLPPSTRERVARGLRVFLDVAYERAGDDFLVRKVLPALDASRRLVVVSTPAAFQDVHLGTEAASPNWLCHEVEHFFDQRGAAAVPATVVVLGPGAPIDRFPGRLADNPRWDWVDLRAFRRLAPWRESTEAAVVKLVGWLLEIPDELLPALHQEARQRRQRLLLAVAGGALAIAAAMAGLAGFALYQRGIAEERLRLAQQQQSISLAALADLKLTEGDGTSAQLLALEGLPQSGGQQRPQVAAAEAALYRAAVAGRERHLVDLAPCSAAALAFAHQAPLLLTGCFAGNRATAPLLIDTATGQVRARLAGHTARVDRIAFSRDDRQLATASADGTVRVWDTASGREVAKFTHQGPASTVMFDRSGSQLLTAGEDGLAVLWALPGGERQRAMPYGGGQGARALYDGATEHVLTLNPQAGQATLWRAADGARLQVLPQPNVRDAIFADHDLSLVTAGNGRASLWRWDGRRYALKAPLVGHDNAIADLAVSPDGHLVATCSFDSTVRLWDARTGAAAGMLSLGATNTCFAVRFSPDGHMLATGDDRVARLWRLPDLRPLHTLASVERPVTRLEFASDGRLASSSNETLSLWDARADPTLLHSEALEDSTDLEPDPATGRLWRLAADGSADSLGFDGSRTPLPGFSHAGTSSLVRFDDGSWLRFQGDGDVEGAPTPAAAASWRVAAQGGKPPPLAYRRDSPLLASAEGPRVLVRDRRAPGTAPRVLDTGNAPVQRLALNPDAGLLAVNAGSGVAAYELPTLALRWHANSPPGKPDHLIISATARAVIGAWDDGRLNLWEIADGRLRCSWETGDEPVFDLSVSPDGTQLVLGTNLSRFFALDTRDCSVRHAFDRTDGFAIGMDILFTRSGRRVFTAAGDGWVHLWDMGSGTLLQAFDATPRGPGGEEHQAEALDIRLALSNDEDRLLVLHGQGLRIWSLLPEGEALTAQVRRSVPRPLTERERQVYGLTPAPTRGRPHDSSP